MLKTLKAFFFFQLHLSIKQKQRMRQLEEIFLHLNLYAAKKRVWCFFRSFFFFLPVPHLLIHTILLSNLQHQCSKCSQIFTQALMALFAYICTCSSCYFFPFYGHCGCVKWHHFDSKCMVLHQITHRTSSEGFAYYSMCSGIYFCLQ